MMLSTVTFAAKLNLVTVSSNQPEFVLKLKSNPTTGYSWSLREYNANVVTLVKHVFKAPVKGLIGAPGFDYWTFRVKPAGFITPQSFTIHMVYARPWESKDSGTEVVFRVNTKIEHLPEIKY